MQDNIIECQNLTHYYGKRLIYENLSFQVPRGRILGLLGKNGTGKTTTINAIIKYLEYEGLEMRLAAPTGRAAIYSPIPENAGYSGKISGT